MARRARGKNRSKSSSSGVFNLRTLMTILVSIAFVIFFFPTCVVLGFSLLPSVVAYIVDRSSGKFLFRCVLSMNACGALPALAELWVAGHDLAAAAAVVADVWYWFYAYSAAAFGWVLYGGVPKVIASYVSLKAQNRVKDLREIQNRLIEEWGQDVARQVRGAGAMGGAEPIGVAEDSLSEDEDDPPMIGAPKTEGDDIVSSADTKPWAGSPGLPGPRRPPMPVAPGRMAEPGAFDDLGDDEMRPGSAPPGPPAFD